MRGAAAGAVLHLGGPDAHHLHAGLLSLFAVARPAAAQFETASVVGTVKDASGAVIADAKVTLTGLDTGVAQTRIADAAGSLRVLQRPHRHLRGDVGEARLLHRPGRRRPGHRRRAPPGRRGDGRRRADRNRRGAYGRAALADRLERSQPGDQRRADARPPAQRPRVLAAGAALARRPVVGAEHRRLHAARRARSTSTACARRSTTSSSTASTTTPTAPATRASRTR